MPKFSKNIEINKFSSFVSVNDFGLLGSKSIFYFKKPKKSGSGCGMFVNKPDKIKDIERVVELETDTLDNYVLQRNIKKIDFVKIDVEGAEMSVLNGGVNTLDNIKPKYIQIEFGRPNETSIDFSFRAQDIFSFLVKKGYKAFYFRQVKQVLKFADIDTVIDSSPGKHLNVIFELI